MSAPSIASTDPSAGHLPDALELVNLVRVHYENVRNIRRSVCLINAGQYDKAAQLLAEPAKNGCADRSLPAYLAACLLGQERYEEAARELATLVEPDDPDPTPQIRHALAMWTGGERDGAIETLREAIRDNVESAELHFQLGVMLAAMDRYDEAELRFVQVVSLDARHVDARVNLAMCCAVRQAPVEAFTHLRRAQHLRPLDARVGLLLSMAAKALGEQGHPAGMPATMPGPDTAFDPEGIEELSLVIAQEPDFVDAFLSIPVGELDEEVFAVLLATLRAALERQPEHAELHYHCGRVLARLGRPHEAIDANERAVAIEPRFTRALIELGRLYHMTDRRADARDRLEQAIAAGAVFADVYFLLGNLYRDSGDWHQARCAYRQALHINESFEAAQNALETLPT